MDIKADTIDRSAPELSSPTRLDEPDPRQSLQHVLSAADDVAPRSVKQESSRLESPQRRPTVWIQEAGKENLDEDRSVQNDSYSRASDINPSHTMTVAHSRRNANGTIGSVYSGNKIRHLKKEDGIPLWRRDIQYSFLRAVFEDTTPVFTDAVDKTGGHSFADIYINAMARSTKTSKILREKLLTDRDAALNMAMICLLVNVGRMNTTLNFFPEMRAQLRTYHSIPCLQAHQDPNANKQLQDAPRLKSILKGSCEDSEQPTTVEKIMAAKIPRTNPVNLIFVLSQYAPKISETHFYQPRDFFDLVIRATLSSRSRAKAFLWLVWWYLESDFSEYDAENSPFGPGLPGDEPDSLPIKVPAFEHLTEEQAVAENVDTGEEKKYGETMRLERKRILEEDETVGPPMKKPVPRYGDNMEDRAMGSPNNGNGPSDMDRTRSPSPSNLGSWQQRAHSHMTQPRKLTGFRVVNNIDPVRPELDRQQPATRIILKTSKMDPTHGSSSPATPGGGVLHHGAHASTHHRRPRPETSHQKAVNENRKMRVENILHKKLVDKHARVRRDKKEKTCTIGYQAMCRISDLPDDYDTEDEGSWGPGGLVPNPDEESDYGGEALAHKKVLDRALRRLGRDDNGGSLQGLARNLLSRKRKRSGERDATQEAPSKMAKGNPNDVDAVPDIGPPEDGLDDLDLDLLGEGRDEESNEESGSEDSEEGDDLSDDGAVDEK